MLIIGSHVGFNKKTQLLGSLDEALSYGANTFMFYTGAPQDTARSQIEDELTLEALNKMKENKLVIVVTIKFDKYIFTLLCPILILFLIAPSEYSTPKNKLVKIDITIPIIVE